MIRLTEEEAATIKSMGMYWEEVAKRPVGGEILEQELRKVYSILGLKLLWITLDHAREIPVSQIIPEVDESQDWFESESIDGSRR